MDPERALVSKIAHSGSGIERMLAMGVEQRHFSDNETGEVWRFMVDHTRKYRQQPSIAAIRMKFPNYGFTLVSDALDYVKDRFVENLIRNTGHEILLGLAKELDAGDLKKWPEMFSEQDRRLQQLLPGSSVERLSSMQGRIDQYHDSVKSGDMHGVKMGIPAFDDVTLGMQPHEFVTVQGWLGTGKSTLAQWMLLNAYQQDRLGMYVSLEMESRALLRKWDVMLTNVSYQNMKAGTLTAEEMKRWKRVADRVAAGKRDIVVTDDVRRCTVDRVYSEMVKHQPDLVVIDYISLMATSRSQGNTMWERLMSISNELKQTARTMKIPIIAVAQTNRDSADGGPELSNIAFSVAINQDSDIVIGMHSDKEMRANRRMQVKMMKNRDGRPCTADLFWDMENMEFGPWDETRMFKRSNPVP